MQLAGEARFTVSCLVRRLDVASWILEGACPAACPPMPIELAHMPPAAVVVRAVELDPAELANVRAGGPAAAAAAVATLLLPAGARTRLVVEILPQATGWIDDLEGADALVADPAASVHRALAIIVDAVSMGSSALKAARVHGAVLEQQLAIAVGLVARRTTHASHVEHAARERQPPAATAPPRGAAPSAATAAVAAAVAAALAAPSPPPAPPPAPPALTVPSAPPPRFAACRVSPTL